MEYADTHTSKHGVNWSEWKGSYGINKCLQRLLMLQRRKLRNQKIWTKEEEEKLIKYVKTHKTTLKSGDT